MQMIELMMVVMIGILADFSRPLYLHIRSLRCLLRAPLMPGIRILQLQ